VQPAAQVRYRAKAFAAKTGVTVRTLHVYDRLGLLEPAERTPSGYRLYGDAQLERLEQILALRFVGFSLERIRELLDGPAWPLLAALRMQREIIARRRRSLEAAIDAIDEAERVLAADADANRWETLRTVIEALKMENDYNWTQQYYNEAAREKLAERRQHTPQDVVEQGQRDWTALIADVEAAVAQGEDPSGERAGDLARRWHDLIGQFTQGDADIAGGLGKLWSDPTHWPKDFRRPWSDAADRFIKAATHCKE
jgi:DNA-binding transcriptional MerR regulator